ncbi:MAG: NAD(P)H-hydrate dehydratase [Candidatus Wildermuthbacteria bacterium]|nr:NAD(P)H-hydrate dehydratase [Candidatus Wildermuthbacteria bacterium]
MNQVEAKKVTSAMLRNAYPQRPPEVKKYNYGLLIVIGGSEFYSGSPALAALAGFRAGVDMVRIIAPKRAADIIASFSPILAAYPLDNHHLLQEHVATLLSLTEGAKEVSHGKTAVVIGGGIGRTTDTQEAILEYLSQITVPAVIDADALHAVAKKPEILRGKPFLITPNTFEFQLVTGQEVRALDPEARIPVVQEAAARLETTIVVKARVDIASNGNEILLNETGSPYLSIGGAGDTLAGIAGALAARGVNLLEAGAFAAFINGKAGELAAQQYKESLVATDLIEAIPQVINK